MVDYLAELSDEIRDIQTRNNLKILTRSTILIFSKKNRDASASPSYVRNRYRKFFRPMNFYTGFRL